MTSSAQLLEVEHLQVSIPPKIRVGGIELLDGLAAAWNCLCREADADPFLSPEWIRCYLRAFEPEAEVVIIAAFSGGRLTAVLPLTRKRIWYRGIPLIELKGAANAHSVWFDVLRAPGPEGDAAVKMMGRHLWTLPAWDVLEFPYVPEHGNARQLVHAAANESLAPLIDPSAECPVVNLPVDANGNLDAFGIASARFRHDLRRSARRLSEDLGGAPELICQRKPDPDALRQFYELEAAGWKGSAGTAIQSSRETRAYYDDIVRLTERNGQLLFHRFEVNGRLLAGCLGLQVANSYYGLKMAYDESLRTYSPGQLMLRGIIEECAKASVSRIVLGGKLDMYKRKWTSETAPLVNALVFRSSLRARIAFYERSRLFPAVRRLQDRAQSVVQCASASLTNRIKGVTEKSN